MKIKKLQDGGYPTNVRELLDALSYDLRPSTIAPPSQDEDIRTNQMRRTTPPEPARPDLRNYTPPTQRSIGGGQRFYSAEEQRQREFMRPGGTADQMKSQMGEFAAGMTPGLGDLIEAGYIGRDVYNQDYDAAGLGALLALLPGAMGRYGADAYKAIRGRVLPTPTESQLSGMYRQNSPTANLNTDLKAGADRQGIARPIDNLATSNIANMQRKQVSMLFDDTLDPAIQQPLIDEMIEDGMLKPGATLQDARDLVNKEIDNVEMMYGYGHGYGYVDGSEEPFTVMGYGEMYPLGDQEIVSAASRRGGMPLEESLRRGNLVASDVLQDLQKQIDELEFDAVNGPLADRATAKAKLDALKAEREDIVNRSLQFSEDTEDHKIFTELRGMVDSYFRQHGRLPSDAALERAYDQISRRHVGLSPEHLASPTMRNEHGGKIPYKIKKK